MATQDDVYEATTRGIVDREHWWLMQAVTSDCLRLMKWGGMGSCWADVTVPAVLISVGGPRHGRTFSTGRLHLLGKVLAGVRGRLGWISGAVSEIRCRSTDPEAYEANYRVRDIGRL